MDLRPVSIMTTGKGPEGAFQPDTNSTAQSAVTFHIFRQFTEYKLWNCHQIHTQRKQHSAIAELTNSNARDTTQTKSRLLTVSNENLLSCTNAWCMIARMYDYAYAWLLGKTTLALHIVISS